MAPHRRHDCVEGFFFNNVGCDDALLDGKIYNLILNSLIFIENRGSARLVEFEFSKSDWLVENSELPSNSTYFYEALLC